MARRRVVPETSPGNRAYPDIDSLGGAVTNTFTGSAKLWGLNGVLKWAPNGNPTYNNFKLQGEYFRLKQDGTLTYDDTAGSALFGAVSDYFRPTSRGGTCRARGSFIRTGASATVTMRCVTAR